MSFLLKKVKSTANYSGHNEQLLKAAMEPLVVNEYSLDGNRLFLLMERDAQLTIPGTFFYSDWRHEVVNFKRIFIFGNFKIIKLTAK
jgi:hypothetical protein